MKKIFLTGGHFAPAKAVISALLKAGKPHFAKASHFADASRDKSRGEWQIFYIGRKYAMEGDRAEALEFREIREVGRINYLVINPGRLQRKFFVNIGQSIKALLRIPLGFAQAFWWLLRFRPAVVLSFGGYVAVPVVVGAWLLGIPILTHEQTTVSGLANKIIALLASKVLVSWESSLNYFPKGKAVLTGNPLREEVLDKVKSLKSLVISQKKTTKMIYITGGNQGAHVINEAVGKVLPQLVSKYQIIHQTGDSQIFKDYQKLEKIREKLPKKLQWKYQPYRFLSGIESATVLANADLVISRAGANTVLEIAALGKPSILIPIPWSGGNEQYQNAQLLADLWMAEILPQSELTPKKLLETIESVMTNIQEYKKCAKEGIKLVHLDAAEKIMNEVIKLTR